MEAAPGFEPGIRALQARALPLGYAASEAFACFARLSRNLAICNLAIPRSPGEPRSGEEASSPARPVPGPEDVPAPPPGVNHCQAPADRTARQLVVEALQLEWQRQSFAGDCQHESVALRLHGMEQFGLGAVRESRQQAIRIEIALDST